MKQTLSSLALATAVSAHGFLTVPAPRNGLWKLCPASRDSPFSQPPNFDLMGLNAGGPTIVESMGYGACGDSVQHEQKHASGGEFANGFIAAEYKPGSEIDLTVTITAHHKGYFKFFLCDKGQESQDCFNKHPLQRPNGQTRWNLPPRTGGGNDLYTMKYVLPSEITCDRCVLQWHYETGNSPGNFPEQFFNCADIRISNEVSETKSCDNVSQVVSQEGSEVTPPTPDTSDMTLPTPDNQDCDAIWQESNQKISKMATAIASLKTKLRAANDKIHQLEHESGDGHGNQKVCVSRVSNIPDSWCQGVGCADVYIQSGHCGWQ